jgi:hypothetical protein
MTTRTAITRILGCLVLCPALGLALAATDEHKPKDTGLVEKAGAHLGQIDVAVTGPRDAASRLTSSDFEVRVGKQWLKALQLDAMCASDTSTTTARPASYLFYFDQRHLTTSGRRRALEVLREMVPLLIVGGSRGMLVSSAKALKVYTTFTSSPEEVLKALEELEHDPEQVDSTPLFEEMRVEEVKAVVGEADEEPDAPDPQPAKQIVSCGPRNSPLPKKAQEKSERFSQNNTRRKDRVSSAIGLAERYNHEEMLDAREGFLRIASILRRFGTLDPPKILLYFADTMRRNAGEHFIKMVPSNQIAYARIAKQTGRAVQVTEKRAGDVWKGRWTGKPTTTLETPAGDAESVGSEGAYEDVLAEAAAQNVRFYAVQAEGLDVSSERARDAQDTLASLALGTGGRAFLNAVPAQRMVGDILNDLSCRFLVSFDPRGFAEDRVLPVRVHVRGKGLSAQAGSQIVIQSESARRASRLIAAYSQARKTGSGAISATVIPTGYVHGAFSALIQVVMPPTSGDSGSWEIGGSVVSGNSARDLPMRTIATNTRGIPVIFESEETFPRAQQEVIAVARETASDTVVSQVVEVTWPEIDERVSILPTTVLQPVSGAFARGDATRTHGSLARPESEPLRPEVPTTLVSLVCWPAEQKDPLHVARTLRGDAETILSFPAVDLETGNERCAQVRDTIPAKVLGAGVFRYAVVVSQGQEELARAERTFVVQASP